MLREPAVAGSFYPGTARQLRADLGNYLAGARHDRDYLGLVVPHAGYIYSGAIAALAYKEAQIPRSVLLLGPNHTGLGARVALYPAGSWRTPLGETPIDENLSSELLEGCPVLEADTAAHRFEHSIEVQVPFLQMLREDLRILPITLGRGTLDDWLTLGQQIGAVLKQRDERTLLIASSDMNHFKPAAYTEQVDRLAIERMESFDPAGLFHTVWEKDISMCGVIPAVIMLEATRILGGSSCHLIGYGHSGLVNGDLDSVVGYAALGVE